MPPRSIEAQVAHFRNSAGSMKDRRVPRGGSRNSFREALEEWEEDLEINQEIKNSFILIEE